MENNLEIWIPIIGYEDKYEVSNLGRIKSLNRILIDKYGISYNLKEKFLKPGIDSRGYKMVVLNNMGHSKNSLLHRLIAIHFIPNPYNKPVVNHIDGNKLNNSLENLEWCTYGENAKHAFRIGLKKATYTGITGKNHPTYGMRGSKSPVSKKVINTKTGDIYETITEAAKVQPYSLSYISMMLNGIKPNKTYLKFK